MKQIILLFLFSCFFSGCIPERRSEEFLYGKNLNLPLTKGYISNNRYYSGDRSFSVIVEGLDIFDAEIFENKDEICTSVAFSFYSGLFIRYDMFPIDDLKMLFALCEASFRNEFFKIFLHEIILPPLRAKCPSIEINFEDVVSIGDESYYFGLIHGPISKKINSATGQRSEDYSGILIGLKGQNILVVHLQRGGHIYRCKETAKEELLSRLQYFYDECLGSVQFQE